MPVSLVSPLREPASDADLQLPIRRQALPDRCGTYTQKCAQKLQTTPFEAA
jgi:hypothetical protein